MTTYSLRFLEAFRLEEVPLTKRKVFPEEKKWPKALRKEFNEGNLDSHLPKKFSKFRSSLLHTLFKTRLVKEPKIFQIAAGLSGNCPK